MMSTEPPTSTPSLVHTLERTDPQPLDVPGCIPRNSLCDESVSFRHSAWQQHRRRILAALRFIGTATIRQERFAWCGTNAWVVTDPNNPDHLRIASNCCRDRFCTPCGQDRSRRLVANLAGHIADRELRLITLTLRHQTTPLTAQLDHLYASFRRLRREPTWKNHVTGGIAFCEAKLARDQRTWHPHLHILCEGTYLPHAVLSTAWHRITGTSYVVHITKIRDVNHAARYAAKYCAKPISLGFTRNIEKLREALSALKARHLAITFGTWRGWALFQQHDSIDWQPLLPLRDLLRRVRLEDPWALNLLSKLRKLSLWTPDKKPNPAKFPRPPPSSSLCVPPTPSSAPVAASA